MYNYYNNNNNDFKVINEKPYVRQIREVTGVSNMCFYKQ